MYESAERINKDIINLFNSIPINEFSNRQKEDILNIIIRFGSVAKFRCRSNVAYDNFVNACFKEIANTKRIKVNENDEYEVLHATLKEVDSK